MENGIGIFQIIGSFNFYVSVDRANQKAKALHKPSSFVSETLSVRFYRLQTFPTMSEYTFCMYNIPTRYLFFPQATIVQMVNGRIVFLE